MKHLTHCLALAVTFAASGAPAADAGNGERLAERWCAACHVVTPRQRSANADAPAFATIARMAGFSAERLSYFLLDPHPRMPNMALTRNEASDIAAYIGTLAK